MYYSQYDTGIFKCCTAVYGAPTRNYFFDTQFLNPSQPASRYADVPGRRQFELSPELHTAVSPRVEARVPRSFPARENKTGAFFCSRELAVIFSNYARPGNHSSFRLTDFSGIRRDLRS